MVLTEGWDQPSVKCAILACPSKSTAKVMQQAGRILRPYKGMGAIILDHAGCILEHGLPQDDREFSLEAKEKKRRTVTTTCKTCPECFAIVPLAARVCPNPECNFTFPPPEAEDKTEEKPGELVEVRPATVDEKRAAWDEICATAIAKGYKPGWAFYRYQDKFGVKPPSSFTFPQVERPPATDEEKRDYLEQLRDTQQARGYKIGWLYQRYRAKFGEEIPAAWLAPRLVTVEPEPVEYARAAGDDFEPGPELEEWPF